MICKVKSLLKKNKILHFIATYFRDKEFRKSYNTFLKNNSLKKSRKIIQRELKLLGSYWECPPYHYYLYSLYRKELSDEQLLDYIPPHYYYVTYWGRRHIGLDQTLYWSKVYQYHLFKKFNIPTMDIVAVIRKGVLRDLNNEILEFDKLINNFLRAENDAFFIKPEFGRGGKGIFLLSKKNGRIFINNKQTLIEKVVQLLPYESYIVQERFEQSRQMNEINRFSVNTLRIGTKIVNDEAVVSFCMLRMSANNSFVDNMSAGGIIIVVDINDGSLADYAQSPDAENKFYKHPTSNYEFKNSRIENWQEIKYKILQYANLLRECKDLGWDVAVSENGFKVLEINIYFALDQQPAYNGMRRILGVYPD